MDYRANWWQAFREAVDDDRPFAIVNFENGVRTFFNC